MGNLNNYSQKTKWYFRGPTIFIGFLVVGPLVLPLVWAKPEYSRAKKVFVTTLILVITAILMISAPLILQQVYQFALTG